MRFVWLICVLVSLALRRLGSVYCGGVVRRWLVLFSWAVLFR